MSQSDIDLSKLFGAAMSAINENRDELNGKDEENHPNHGDNVYNNLNVIKNTLQSQQDQSPSDALRAAAEAVAKDGKGSTAPQYAAGLQQAAIQLEGKDELNHNDVATVLHSMLGGQQQPGQATADPISNLAGLVTGGQQAAGQPQRGAVQSGQASAILGKVAKAAIPAAMGFMMAKASGANSKSAFMSAATQAAMGSIMGANPLQAATSGGASGGLIAQSIMKALMGQ